MLEDELQNMAEGCGMSWKRTSSLLCMLKSDGGVSYCSKLDDFEAFVARSKMATLQLQPSRTEQQLSQGSQASQSQRNTQSVPQVRQPGTAYMAGSQAIAGYDMQMSIC